MEENFMKKLFCGVNVNNSAKIIKLINLKSQVSEMGIIFLRKNEMESP